MNCEDCGFQPPVAANISEGSYANCYDCASEHMYVGKMPDGTVRRQITVGGEQFSPDGVIWYAPDTLRHRDGRPLRFVEAYADYIKRERPNDQPITVMVHDPNGLLGETIEAIMIGGGTVN